VWEIEIEEWKSSLRFIMRSYGTTGIGKGVISFLKRLFLK